jgi:hypothetical protein
MDIHLIYSFKMKIIQERQLYLHHYNQIDQDNHLVLQMPLNYNHRVLDSVIVHHLHMILVVLQLFQAMFDYDYEIVQV